MYKRTISTDSVGKHLGEESKYKFTYDPALLERIPREVQRSKNLINNSSFNGYDVWGCYEVSVLTTKGRPVDLVLKITYSSNSNFIVESKSLKLYLMSFNLTVLGDSVKECVKLVKGRVVNDLSNLLQTQISVSVVTSEKTSHILKDYRRVPENVLNKIDFFKEDCSLEKENSFGKTFKFTTSSLRSNCRKTNQPDWGDVFVLMEGKYIPTERSMVKYIVSHRESQHFHEEMCEIIYQDLSNTFNPEILMVACLYLRRGGIDINPVRCSHEELIPEYFTLGNSELHRTFRQ